MVVEMAIVGDRLGRRLAEGRQVQLHRSGGGEGGRRLAAVGRYAPKGTNSATARQLFIDGKIGVPARRALGLGRGREGAAPRCKPQPEGRRRCRSRSSRAARRNSLHIAAKTDAKKKEAAWNFIVMAAQPRVAARATR